MPSATRTERKAETRAALLRSASRLFRERGLDGTSVEQIASDAGYTKGAFYANFASKEKLFLIMLDEKFAVEMKRLDAALGGDEEPGAEAREAALDFIRFVWSDPEWPKLFFEFTAYAGRDVVFREELASRYRAVRERITEVYRRWARDFPVEPPFSFEDIATMTLCMANGYLMEQLIEPELNEELYGTMMLTFFRGIQALAVGWEPPEDLEEIERS